MLIIELNAWNAEIDWMTREEEAKETEYWITELEANMKKCNVFCMEKGEEELRARTDVRMKTELAKKRDRELREAEAYLALCLRRSKQRDKLKRKVTHSCKFVDTASITGFHQRFTTENLRARLYWQYFRKIVDSIVNKAETIASERCIMRVQEKLSSNRDSLLDRTRGMKTVWRDIQREELMRMRKSLLCQKFFPKHRHHVLKARFGGWVRFFYWNRGHREAFDMKYEIILQQIRIDKQFKDQLALTKDKNKDKENQNPGNPNTASGRGKSLKSSALMSTMQKHKERPVQCKICINFYLESQNCSFSCLFHPGVFTFCCPKNCKNPGLTQLCIAHKRKRWTCCDHGNENVQGCGRRYHVAQDVDPIYDRIMKKIDERDIEMLHDLDERLEVARSSDWVLRAKEAKRGRLHVLEDKVN